MVNGHRRVGLLLKHCADKNDQRPRRSPAMATHVVDDVVTSPNFQWA